MICAQIVTITPDGEGERDHTHECVYCGKIKIFPTEELPEALVAMLQRLVNAQQMGASIQDDPPTYIH